jgi:hypothetical protein
MSDPIRTLLQSVPDDVEEIPRGPLRDKPRPNEPMRPHHFGRRAKAEAKVSPIRWQPWELDPSLLPRRPPAR